MAKKRILVVEDEQDIAELIVYNLRDEGYQVLSANTGESGLKAAEDELPDLVLRDIMLPGINGLDVARTRLVARQVQPMLAESMNLMAAQLDARRRMSNIVLI